jgi:hypothetical protein
VSMQRAGGAQPWPTPSPLRVLPPRTNKGHNASLSTVYEDVPVSARAAEQVVSPVVPPQAKPRQETEEHEMSAEGGGKGGGGAGGGAAKERDDHSGDRALGGDGLGFMQDQVLGEEDDSSVKSPGGDDWTELSIEFLVRKLVVEALEADDPLRPEVADPKANPKDTYIPPRSKLTGSAYQVSPSLAHVSCLVIPGCSRRSAHALPACPLSRHGSAWCWRP